MSLPAVLGPQLTAEQATLIFQLGQEAVVVALLTLAEKQATPVGNNSSAPSGQTPPHSKPAAKGRAKPKGARHGWCGGPSSGVDP